MVSRGIAIVILSMALFAVAFLVAGLAGLFLLEASTAPLR